MASIIIGMAAAWRLKYGNQSVASGGRHREKMAAKKKKRQATGRHRRRHAGNLAAIWRKRQ
jgi:hypothetical protein